MNCADFQTRLDDDFNGSRTCQAPDLIEHAAHCATCRATLDGFRLLAEGIGAWRDETPDADLATAVVFALRQPLQPTPESVTAQRRLEGFHRRTRRSPAFVITGAAALLIVATLLIVLRPRAQSERAVAIIPPAHENLATANGQRHDEDRSANGHSAAAVSDDTGARQDVAQADEPASETVPYYDLAQRAAGAFGQMTMLVLPANAAESVPSSAVKGPPTDRSAGWMDEFERELKPVGRSLGNAFDFLWRAGESAGG
jgi:hypothetical protein